ncbi:hypothetical protein EDD16DRAFT_134681 [Pisolithus croceorrhizus]|nr:hypothetical protein EDD16DRAFT_134681 [Pisolithus croceorrhizus]
MDVSKSPPPLMKAAPANHCRADKSLPPSPPLSATRSHSHSSSGSSSRSAVKDSKRQLPTVKELMRLLAVEQDTTRDLQQELSLVTSQLAFEQDRADAAERKLKDMLTRFKDANNTRLVAQADVARLTEELRLYKVALEEAQKEIFKAQNVLQQVEDQKREAEEEATKLRRKVRKMNEEKIIELAREEGRKQGLREGIQMGNDVGYLNGRNKGYVTGRATTDRVMEKYFAAPDDKETHQLRGLDEAEPPYAATTTHFPTSNGSGSSSSLPLPNKGGSSRSRGRAAPASSSARTTLYSPAGMHAEIPFDGWIPEADSSFLIRLPAPHELARPPPTPTTGSPALSNRSPSPMSPRIPVPVPAEQYLHMVPEPRPPTQPPSEIQADRRPPRARRRSSGDSLSSSTRTSELDLLHAPEHIMRGNPAGGLSPILEASFQESLTPSSGSGKHSSDDLVDENGFVHVSMPQPRTHVEVTNASRSPQCLSVDQKGSSRPASTSSSGTFHITIQPPSRPASNNSQSTISATRAHLLSPADADRPMPLPTHQEEPPTIDPLSLTDNTTPIPLPDGVLPPGFVPAGPPAPLTQASRDTRYTAADVPHRLSKVETYSHCLPSHVSYSGSTVAAPLPNGSSVKGDGDTPAVIPPPLGKFARREDSDDSSSDAESLSTTPTRYRVPSNARYTPSTTTYGGGAAGVPLPPSGYTAAGITLPSSSVSGTPYSYTRSPGVDALYMSMNANAGTTPAALGRVKSFSTDRGTSIRG